MKRFIIWPITLIGIIMMVACSQTSTPTPESEPTATPEPTAIPEPTAAPTDEPTAKELPVTPLSAFLGADPEMSYKVTIGTFENLEFDESELPAPPSSVEAHWYKSGGRYVVAYIGLDLSVAGPLCPGNSIRTDTGFEFVSNAPTEEGACEGFTTVTSDPDVGPRACKGILFYVTAIPSDKQGTLYGTLEKLVDDGAAFTGLTSKVEITPDIPEINLDDFCA
jgi:hypothetical protein